MRVFILVLSILAFLCGLVILVYSKSAIHEIEAFVLYLISAVLLSGSAIIRAINRLSSNIEKQKENKSQASE